MQRPRADLPLSSGGLNSRVRDLRRTSRCIQPQMGSFPSLAPNLIVPACNKQPCAKGFQPPASSFHCARFDLTLSAGFKKPTDTDIHAQRGGLSCTCVRHATACGALVRPPARVPPARARLPSRAFDLIRLESHFTRCAREVTHCAHELHVLSAPAHAVRLPVYALGIPGHSSPASPHETAESSHVLASRGNGRA